jgi:hypothetical protein
VNTETAVQAALSIARERMPKAKSKRKAKANPFSISLDNNILLDVSFWHYFPCTIQVIRNL